MKREGSNECKEPQKLYKIGMFSQMNRITVKTLRYYDDIGILKPESVDEINGYRYYTSTQLPRLHKILSLREIGFSIGEIKDILQGTSEEAMLLKKKSFLLKELSEISKKIGCIEGYLSGTCLDSEYHVITKAIPEVIVASVRVHLEGYEQLFDKMPEMGLEMEKAGCECQDPPYCFTIYYDEEYREGDVHAEICEAVTCLKEDRGEVTFKVLPEIPLAACVLHKGPYEKLPKAYSAVVQFIEESGYEIIGYQREYYIDGIWNKDTEEEWLTEIQFPVRKSGLGL